MTVPRAIATRVADLGTTALGAGRFLGPAEEERVEMGEGETVEQPHFLPVTRTIGAEVCGMDLKAAPTPELESVLREGLGRYHVLFFRDQHLDDAGHLAWASVLGEPLVHPFERAMGRTSPIHGIVDKPEDTPDRAGWHTDDSYLERPPTYALLRCEVAPEVGGDTGWCNMVEAYERLSPEMRSFLDGLTGIHSTEGELLDYVRTHLPPDRLAAVLDEVGTGAEHPIVLTHPETGRRALFFEPNFMTRIVGLSASESRFVCDFLAAQVRDISLQCRFRWREGDLAIWDERTTQHIGSADHAGQLRVLRRCTVVGERPF